MLKDMMSHFELFQPADLDNAFDLLDRFGEDCWTIAGGQDSLDWFKDRSKQPSAVIDLAGIRGSRASGRPPTASRSEP